MRNGARLSAYTGGDLDLSTPEGALRDQAKRREREMAILRQRVEFDWRVWRRTPSTQIKAADDPFP